jgi:predicted PurR-regulated permease PerM
LSRWNHTISEDRAQQSRGCAGRTQREVGTLQQTTRNAPDQIELLWRAIRNRIPVDLPDDPAVLISAGLSRAISFIAPRAGGALAGFTGVLGSLVTMLFALFFVLRDGEAMSVRLRDWLPFSAAENQRLMEETRDLVIASVGAGLIVAAAQGAIGGAAFWFLGLGAPVVWAVVIAFASLIPAVGSALVWLPAALWLLLSGDVGRGLTMLFIGVFGISMVDNVLRPMVFRRWAQIHPFITIIGAFAGIQYFGLLGLLIGPLAISYFFELIRMYRDEYLRSEEEAQV